MLDQAIGIFGGSFDPVHFGHLRLALAIAEDFDLKEVRLVPCLVSTYQTQQKTIQAHANDRLDLLQLACANTPLLSVDDCELTRTTSSYSVDTLTELRVKFPNTPLCFILGSDTFATLDSWHHWQEIPQLCHLIVAIRPGTELPSKGPLHRLLAERLQTHAVCLRQQLAGSIVLHEANPLMISSSDIRQLLKTGRNPQFLLPETVLNAISERKLYVIS